MQLYYLYAEVLACVLVFAVVHFALMRSDLQAYTRQNADESAGSGSGFCRLVVVLG